ncbi:hypothetical protein [Candidatus Entotheonella palauensis]|uniref:t-SNARE coiled-coil homology domain-containing protein n=1 Tax=Candidatus Entotheonella gemina TaxID=1429439 RepID=W4MDX9_9BACT|nr:hypothetical protein [Candidatus Entotheonella palauensis]ETX08423.1 MAG: hypothetical protein ETSY2_05510 [Candidatus Entotheonella gemina]
MQLIRMVLLVFLLAVMLLVPAAAAQSDTLAHNREILDAINGMKQEMVRIEQSLKADLGRLEARLQATNQRLDDFQQATNQRLDDMQVDIQDVRADLRDIRTNIWWIVGLVFTALLGMVGFALWDRRSALTPATRRIDRVETALKEMAGSNPVVAEALRKAGIL